MDKDLVFHCIVTIMSYEEFVDLMNKTGNNEIATMELVEAIATINGEIDEQTKFYGIT